MAPQPERAQPTLPPADPTQRGQGPFSQLEEARAAREFALQDEGSSTRISLQHKSTHEYPEHPRRAQEASSSAPKELQGGPGLPGRVPGEPKTSNGAARGSRPAPSRTRRRYPEKLEELIVFAVQANEHELGNATRYQGPAFAFAAIVKGHPEMEHLSADQAADRITSILSACFPDVEDAWETLGDRDSFGNPKDPFADFLSAWSFIVEPRKGDRVDRALELSRKNPLDLGRSYAGAQWTRFREFLSLCFWLFHLTGGKPFFAPCHLFAEALGIDPASVSRYRGQAVKAGFLRETAPSVGRMKATEFVFCMEKLPQGEK